MSDLGHEYFSFVNCIGRPGPYAAKDVEFDLIRECARDYDKVIALGGFASKALQKLHISHFVLPHPSGLNRRLNDREYEKKVLRECYEYVWS